MQEGPPTRSTIHRQAPRPGDTHQTHPARQAFPTMAIMMMLPVMVGAIAMMVNNMGGFIEAAFMDMTLTLENFNYKFGPGECGGWTECGNATFESYQRARDLALTLFVVALVVVAFKDMIKGGLGGDITLEAVDTKTLPAMLQYSVLVIVFLFIFPPIWDVSSGLMNNVGVWILNPHYDMTREYVHGSELRGQMCGGDITHDDLVGLAPYVRNSDAWAVFSYGDGPMTAANVVAPSYREANNYIIPKDASIPRACLNDGQCPAHVNARSPPSGYQIGDILCNPDYKVKYVFRQALGVVEMDAINPEQVLGAVTGVGGDDIMVAIFTQFLKSSVTLQVIMVVFVTGVMVDVVTAFALAILPVVPFYRFLPMSDKVRLGDYSGAAFALLAMPLVASLVLVAGAGAVASMAVDDGENFASFFTWLAAISVVLLVIAIPATMVPLIGSAQAQATAALQTGVQTAQFAATAVAASAGGALRGRRESREFSALKKVGPDARSPLQQARYDQLKKAGYGEMSTARAALMGGTSGLRSQMFDAEGKPTGGFRETVMPGTQEFTQASVSGLGGFETGDEASKMGGLVDKMGGAVPGIATAAQGASAGKPTNKELLDGAAERKAEAEEEANEAEELVNETDENMRNTDGFEREAEDMLEAERLLDGERKNLESTRKRLDRTNTKLEGLEAKEEDLLAHREKLRDERESADAARREEIKTEITKTNKEMRATRNQIKKLGPQVDVLGTEMERAEEAIKRHTDDVAREFQDLAERARRHELPEGLRTVVLERLNAGVAQDAANDNLLHATRIHDQLVSDAHRHPEEYGHDDWYHWDGTSDRNVPRTDGGGRGDSGKPPPPPPPPPSGPPGSPPSGPPGSPPSNPPNSPPDNSPGGEVDRKSDDNPRGDDPRGDDPTDDDPPGDDPGDDNPTDDDPTDDDPPGGGANESGLLGAK